MHNTWCHQCEKAWSIAVTAHDCEMARDRVKQKLKDTFYWRVIAEEAEEEGDVILPTKEDGRKPAENLIENIRHQEWLIRGDALRPRLQRQLAVDDTCDFLRDEDTQFPDRTS